MNPRLSVLPLFAAVALIPSVLASVAQAQATYEEKKRAVDWLAAREQISANDDSSNPSQIEPSDLAYLARARALMKANDIAAARLIFTRLATNGVAEAAFDFGTNVRSGLLTNNAYRGLRAGS
jgi:hypothetical protein